MKNTVTINGKHHGPLLVSDLPGGALADWHGRIYVVLSCKTASISAVCLVDGGHLGADAEVIPLNSGESVTVVMGLF